MQIKIRVRAKHKYKVRLVLPSLWTVRSFFYLCLNQLQTKISIEKRNNALLIIDRTRNVYLVFRWCAIVFIYVCIEIYNTSHLMLRGLVVRRTRGRMMKITKSVSKQFLSRRPQLIIETSQISFLCCIFTKRNFNWYQFAYQFDPKLVCGVLDEQLFSNYECTWTNLNVVQCLLHTEWMFPYTLEGGYLPHNVLPNRVQKERF